MRNLRPSPHCVWIVVLGAILMSAGETEAAVGPGMGLDEASEKRLAEQCAAFLEECKADTPDYTALAASIVASRREAEHLLALAEKSKPRPVDTPAVPERAPVVLPPGASLEEVRALWKEQLALRIRAVYEMLTGKQLADVPKWSEVIGVGWRYRRDRSKRARPTAFALREAQVLALLLAREPMPIHVAPGEVLFADDFRKGTGNWYLYGPAETTLTEKGLRRRNLRRRNADSMIWTKRAFAGNFLVEFTVIPNNGGRYPGLLFAVCGRPVKPGTNLSVSCGETMDDYNYGVHAYHFSVHRGLTGITNGRKVGTGLHLIASRPGDPARETGKAYRIAIGKWENVVFFLVDGRLVHEYYDGGTFGPPLAGGHVGMRHWGGADATYSDFRVTRLIRKSITADEQGE